MYMDYQRILSNILDKCHDFCSYDKSEFFSNES